MATTADAVRSAAIANVEILAAVDAAEAEGDALKAWQLVEADRERREPGERFWHPERLGRLQQLSLLDGVLPRWASSRWILAQAAKCLHPARRQPQKRAFDDAVRIIGGLERYPGVDEIDSTCKLMDYDWVYRQLMVYQYGGLHFFLDHVTSRELVERADRIVEWAAVPMGAYQLREATQRSLLWLDLASGGEVETPNIGSAALLVVGECAIGRLAPIEGGRLFESAPLFVPTDVADRVAAAPDDWVAALEEGRDDEAPFGERISTVTNGFPLLTDVPGWQREDLIERVVGQGRGPAFRWSQSELVDACVAVVRAAMGPREDFGHDLFDPWPAIGSLVLEPAVLRELTLRPRVGDGDGFERLAERLADPAGRICRALAMRPDLLREGA